MTADARVERSDAAYFLIGEKREIARARFVDSGDAGDVEIGIAFEPALDARRDV